MARHVNCQATVGEIDVGMRAFVHEGGELDCGHDARSDSADGANLAIAGNEHRCLTVRVRENSIGEYAASRAQVLESRITGPA